jgi:cytochrome c553
MKTAFAVCLMVLACSASAQDRPGQAAAQARPIAAQHGSPQAGQQIATAGGANGVTACLACHGAKGEGNAAGNFPMLAGQPEAYLLRQMVAFANGGRDNPVMTPIAKAMNQQQMRDASAWYASLAAPAAGTAAPKLAPAQTQRGMALTDKGDNAKQVQACANCHGPGGAGEAPTYPALAGQHAGYFVAAMAEWKTGTRKTDPSGQMPSIAKKLDDNDVAALAAYYAAMPAKAPALRTNVPAGSTARPAIAARANGSGPPSGGAAAAPQGVGSEQGAPLTGGSQGPGGGGGTQGTNPGQAQGSQGSQQQQPKPPPAPKPGDKR